MFCNLFLCSTAYRPFLFVLALYVKTFKICQPIFFVAPCQTKLGAFRDPKEHEFTEIKVFLSLSDQSSYANKLPGILRCLSQNQGYKKRTL